MQSIKTSVLVCRDMVSLIVQGEARVFDSVCVPAYDGTKIGVIGLSVLQISSTIIIAYHDVLVVAIAVRYHDRLYAATVR